MDEALIVWTAAIESGFCRPAEWVKWADEQIGQMERPPQWILELAVACSVPEALTIVWPAWVNIPSEIRTSLDYYDLYLGFLYLRFERGNMEMLDLLLEAGQKADCWSWRIPCEEFFWLANEIHGGGPTMPSDQPLPERVGELFKPMADLARWHWTQTVGQALPDKTDHERDP